MKSFLVIFITLLLQSYMIDGALNIHRNFAEDLIGSIKDHVYVGHSYTIEREQATPTCNSIDGTLCSFLIFQRQEDLTAPKEHNRTSDAIETSRSHQGREVPVFPELEGTRRASVPLESTYRPIPIFEAGIGDDSDSYSFASVSGDAITWLVSKGGVFGKIWDLERRRNVLEELSRNNVPKAEHQLAARKRNEKLLAALSKLESQSGSVTQQEVTEVVGSYRWWDTAYWLKRIDQFAESIADMIFSDIDLEEEEEAKEFEKKVEPLKTLNKPSDKKHNGEQKIDKDKGVKPDPHVSWKAMSKIIEFTKVPLEFESLPEYYGSSSSSEFDVSVRWTGDWKVEGLNGTRSSGREQERSLGQAFPKDTMVDHEDDPAISLSCANLAGVEGSIFFSWPVLVSELILQKVPPELHGTSEEEKNFEQSRKSHDVRQELPLDSNGDFKIESNSDVEVRSERGSSATIESTTEMSHGHNNNSELKTKLVQQVRVDGWYWNQHARKEFREYLEQNEELEGSDRWFFSPIPEQEIEKRHITRVWSILLDLQSQSIDVDSSFSSLLWDQYVGFSQVLLNVIDRVNGAPYSRIDGITIRYGVGKSVTESPLQATTSVASHFTASVVTEPLTSSQQEKLKDFFTTSNSKSATKNPLTVKSRMGNAPGICINRLLIHRVVPTFPLSDGKLLKPLEDPKAWETTAIKPGVLIREIGNDLTSKIFSHPPFPYPLSLERSMPFPQEKNPKILNFYDRYFHSASLRVILEEQRKSYQSPSSSYRFTQPLTPPPPFGRSVAPRVLPVPMIASDGIILSQDWRHPMKRLQVVLQHSIPIEAPLISLSDLQTSNSILIHKPSPVTSVSLALPSGSHPGPIGYESDESLVKSDLVPSNLRDILEKALNAEGQSQEEVVVAAASDQFNEGIRTELALLKRKLMEAAKSALEEARRKHEMSRTTHELEKQQHQESQETSNHSPPSGASPNAEAIIQQSNSGTPHGAVVMSHADGRISSLDDDWESLSQVVGSEMAAALRGVLKEHHQQMFDGSSQQERALDPSIFKSVDVIELVQKDGEIVAKRMTVDLTEEMSSLKNTNLNGVGSDDISERLLKTEDTESDKQHGMKGAEISERVPSESQNDELQDDQKPDVSIETVQAVRNGKQTAESEDVHDNINKNKRTTREAPLEQLVQKGETEQIGTTHAVLEAAKRLEGSQQQSLLEALKEHPDAQVTIKGDAISVFAQWTDPNFPSTIQTVQRTYFASKQQNSAMDSEAMLEHKKAVNIAKEAHERLHEEMVRHHHHAEMIQEAQDLHR